MPKVTEEHLEAKRLEILHAAIACFARDGFHKTTMIDIAREAGVSDGLAYRYFSGKDEIIEEAIRLGSAGGRLTTTVAVDTDDVNSMLNLIYRSSFERFHLPGRGTTLRLRFRAWSEALDTDDVREEVVGRWEHHSGVAERLLARGQEEGLIPPELDPRAVARVLLAIHDGLDVQWSFDPSLDVSACRAVVMALLQGRFALTDDEPEDAG